METARDRPAGHWPSRIKESLGYLGVTAVVLAFASPLFYACHLGDDGRRVCEWVLSRGGSTDDWRMFSGAWEAARVSLLQFGQWPSWNPYHCGGVVLFQDPQTAFPGLPFLLFFWLPTLVAMKLSIVAYLLTGAYGMCKVVEDRGGNAAEQVFAGTLVAACGFCAEHFGGGHLSFTPFLVFPWVLWAHQRAIADPRWSVLTAGLLASSVFFGATYPVPLMAVGLGLDVLSRFRDPAARAGMLRSLPLTALLTTLLSGVRLVPVLGFLREHPRLMPLDDQMTLAEVVQTWTTRDHDRAFPGHTYVWPEYGDYVGVAAVALLCLAVVATLARTDAGDDRGQRRRDLFVLAGLVWCALGNIPGVSLFGLLHELPVFRSLRVPSRFLHPATVMLGLMAATFLIDARRWVASRPRPWALKALVVAELCLAVGVAVDVARTNQGRLQQGSDPVIPSGTAGRSFFQDPEAPYWRWPTNAVRGVGSPACYVAFEWQTPLGLRAGRVDQQWVADASAGTVAPEGWSPNALRFRVALGRGGTVVINQHHDSSWTANVGIVVERDGLLAVELPSGSHSLELKHRPRGLGLGVLLSALGIVLSAWVLRRGRRDGR